MINQLLSEQYRPKTLDDLIGQEGTGFELRRWMDSWLIGKPAYLCVFEYGPPGTGKTSSVFALANEYNLDVVEINASEFRTAKELKNELWSSVYFTPDKSDKQNLILIDEVDGILNGRGAKKAFNELQSLIEESKCPIILACNEEYDVRKVTSFFKNNALMIKFSKIKDYKLHMRISQIAKEQNIKIPDINKLVEVSAGDLRFALNNIDSSSLPTRDAKPDIFKLVAQIMRGEWNGDSQGFEPEFIWYVVSSNLEGFYNTVGPWSVPEFKEKMDRIFQYIWRTKPMEGKGSYRYWRYAVMMMRMMGPHQKTAKIIIPHKEISDIRNGWIPESKRDDIIQAYARHCHMSYRKATSILDFNPGIITIFRTAPKVVEEEKPIESEFIPVQVIKSMAESKGIFDYSSD